MSDPNAPGLASRLASGLASGLHSISDTVQNALSGGGEADDRIARGMSTTAGPNTDASRFTGTSGGAVGGRDVSDVPSAGPDAVAGPGAVAPAPPTATPEQAQKNREEREFKDSPVAVLGSGEHVPATGGTNEVGEPMIRAEGKDWRASPTTHS